MRLDPHVHAVHSGRTTIYLLSLIMKECYNTPEGVYRRAKQRAALPERASEFVRVCPDGVDVEAFDPARRSVEMRGRLLRRAGGGDRSVLLFYAGRLSPEKNLDLMAELARFLSSRSNR